MDDHVKDQYTADNLRKIADKYDRAAQELRDVADILESFALTAREESDVASAMDRVRELLKKNLKSQAAASPKADTGPTIQPRQRGRPYGTREP